jgi:hypothetical protein
MIAFGRAIYIESKGEHVYEGKRYIAKIMYTRD